MPTLPSEVLLTDTFNTFVTKVNQIKDYLHDTAASISIEPTITATAGQTVFNMTTTSYTVGSKALMVYVNGSRQSDGYVETNSTRVTFNVGRNINDKIDFVVFNQAILESVDNFKTELASGVGSTKIGHTYPEAPTYLKLTSDINNGQEINFERFLTQTQINDYNSTLPTLDNTTIINTAFSAISNKKGTLKFNPCNKLIVSDQLIVPSGYITIKGSGRKVTKVFCTSAMTSAMDVFQLNGDEIFLEDIGIFANTNGTNGGNTGVHFINGIGCGYNRVYIENTTNAGIWLDNVTNFSGKRSYSYRTGRTGYTNNHGIMITSRGSYNSFDITLEDDVVINAWRKGITTYTDTSGTFTDLKINRARVLSCGLGGLYIGGVVSGASTHNSIKITNSYSYKNYVNYETAAINDLTFYGNTGGSTLCNYGISSGTGDANLILDGNTVAKVYGNTFSQSETTGIDFRNVVGDNSYINLHNNNIQDSNRSNTGYAPHINLTNTTDSKIHNNTCFDTGAAKSTYGIYENTGSNNNEFAKNSVTNVVNDKIFLTGNSSKLLEKFNNEIVFSLSNGQNDNVISSKVNGILHINAPTASYSITGIVGTFGGDTIVLENYTTQTLTLKHNSVSSSSGNRLLLSGATDYVVPQFGTVTLKYTILSSGAGVWLLI